MNSFKNSVVVDVKLLTGFKLAEIYDAKPDLIVIDMSNTRELSIAQKILIKDLKLGEPIIIDRKHQNPESAIIRSHVMVIHNFDV